MTDRPRTRAPWPPAECRKCGQADPTEGGTRCGAHLRNPGDRPPHCRLQPGARTDHPGFGHCKYHGGSTPAGRIQGRELMLAAQDAELTQKLSEWGYEPVGDPVEVLADLAGMARAMVGYWAARMDAIDPDDQRYTDDKGAEQLRSEVALHERAMDRAAKFAAEIAKHDIDERMARVEEVRVSLVATALRSAIESKAANLTPAQIEVVGDAFHEAMAELTQ